MGIEQPLAALQRRLGASPDPAAEPADEEEAELVPSWIPDGQARGRQRWWAAIRADPGRAGGIALAATAGVAVLVTVFTLMRDDPAPVVSAKLPPVEMVSSAAPRPGAAPAGEPGQPVVVSVVGLVHAPGLVTLAPGARIADAVSAAGGALDGADTMGLNLARHVGDGEQIVVGITAPAGQPPALGSSVGVGIVTRRGSRSSGPVMAGTASQVNRMAVPHSMANSRPAETGSRASR